MKALGCCNIFFSIFYFCLQKILCFFLLKYFCSILLYYLSMNSILKSYLQICVPEIFVMFGISNDHFSKLLGDVFYIITERILMLFERQKEKTLKMYYFEAFIRILNSIVRNILYEKYSLLTSCRQRLFLLKKKYILTT